MEYLSDRHHLAEALRLGGETLKLCLVSENFVRKCDRKEIERGKVKEKVKGKKIKNNFKINNRFLSLLNSFHKFSLCYVKIK